MFKKKVEKVLRPEYRYKTCYIGSSPKKLKSLSRQLLNLKLNQAIDLASFSTKGFAKDLAKSLQSIRSNLTAVRFITEDEVSKLVLEKIVIEKKFRVRGHRIRARGHAATSMKDYCTLNLYLRNNSDN